MQQPRAGFAYVEDASAPDGGHPFGSKIACGGKRRIELIQSGLAAGVLPALHGQRLRAGRENSGECALCGQ